jgi:hypothetical protein
VGQLWAEAVPKPIIDTTTPASAAFQIFMVCAPVETVLQVNARNLCPHGPQAPLQRRHLATDRRDEQGVMCRRDPTANAKGGVRPAAVAPYCAPFRSFAGTSSARWWDLRGRSSQGIF